MTVPDGVMLPLGPALATMSKLGPTTRRGEVDEAVMAGYAGSAT